MLTNTKGDIIKGNFRNGLLNGKVEILFKNQDKFSGEIRGNKKCGKGKYIHQGKGTYDGEYLNDARHGYGILKFLGDEGHSLEGNWSFGIPVSLLYLFILFSSLFVWKNKFLLLKNRSEILPIKMIEEMKKLLE